MSFRDAIIQQYFEKNDSPDREQNREYFVKKNKNLIAELRKLEEEKKNIENEISDLEAKKNNSKFIFSELDMDKLKIAKENYTRNTEKCKATRRLCIDAEKNVLECSEYIFIGDN